MSCNQGCTHDHGHDHAADHAHNRAEHTHGDACGCGHDHANDHAPAETAAPPQTAQQRYDTAVDAYIAAYLACLGMLKQEPKPTADEQKPFVHRLMETEGEAEKAMKALYDEHPHGAVVKQYVASSRALFGRIAILAGQQQNPLGPQHRGDTKVAFDSFKEAERAYADLGFRTISTEGWMLSIPVEHTLHRNVHGLLMNKRDEGEKPVLYALQVLKLHPSLKIAAPGRNMKKIMRKAVRQARRR